MSYITEFHQNFDDVYITKALDQDLSQLFNRASSLLSLLLVVSNGKCLRATLMKSASFLKKSNKHQGVMLCCVERAMYLGLVMKNAKI